MPAGPIGPKYAGRYFDSLTSVAGVPLPSTAVTVRIAGTSTAAVLYSSRYKTATAANPVTSDIYGNLGFYVDPGLYDLVVNGITISSISVAADPLQHEGHSVDLNLDYTYGPASLDGSGRTISDRFSGDLAAAQAKFPNVTGLALTDTLDHAAVTQAMYDLGQIRTYGSYSNLGGRIYADGALVSNKTIYIKDGIVLGGSSDNHRTLKIVATATNAAHTSNHLVRLGPGTGSPHVSTGTRLVNANVVADAVSGLKAIYSDEAQENSGLFNVSASAVNAHVIHFSGSGVMNCRLVKVDPGVSLGTTGEYHGIYLENTGMIWLQDISGQAGDLGAVVCVNGGLKKISQLHGESAHSVLRIDAGVVIGDGITGHPTSITGATVDCRGGFWYFPPGGVDAMDDGNPVNGTAYVMRDDTGSGELGDLSSIIHTNQPQHWRMQASIASAALKLSTAGSGNLLEFGTANATRVTSTGVIETRNFVRVDAPSGGANGIDFREGAIGAEASRYTLQFRGDISDELQLAFGATRLLRFSSTGIGLYNTAPVAQATTAVASAAVVAGAGAAVLVDTTFDGYTIPQIVRAIRLLGAAA